MRELCPTCRKAQDGTFEKMGVGCMLHMNPDYDKYYCHCDGTSPMTKEEEIKEYGSCFDL